VYSRRHLGFSLIELLVVMVIIAVIAAGVSLAINPNGSSTKQINKQGDQLFAQMQYALDDALIRHSALGIVIEKDDDQIDFSRRYSWHRYNGDEWQKATEPLAGKYELAPSLVWEIEVEGNSLADQLDDLLEDKKIRPDIVFYPSGEVTEFAITFTLSDVALAAEPEAIDKRYKIALNTRGEVARYPVGVEEEQ
jgi:general secretion pathway protein H